MKLSAFWAASCSFVLGTALASAHMYPVGEVTPLVLVRDGNFVIYTTEYGNGVMMGTTMYERVHAPDGSIITPKKKSSLSFSDVFDLARQGADSEDAEHLEYRAPAGSPPWDGFGTELERLELYLKAKVKGAWSEKRISLPQGISPSQHLLRSEGVAMACVRNFDMRKPLEAWNNELVFVWLERPALKITFQRSLGQCAFIRPPHLIHSELIWADGRVWFAWIRKAHDFKDLAPAKQWVTMLASYDPKTKKLDQKPLPEQSHYNTQVSINAVKGWLCVAWHCSKDGSYPGESMIVTHFEKTSP